MRPIICLRQPLWKVSSCAPCASVRAQDSAAPYMSRGSTRDLKNLSLAPSPTLLEENRFALRDLKTCPPLELPVLPPICLHNAAHILELRLDCHAVGSNLDLGGGGGGGGGGGQAKHHCVVPCIFGWSPPRGLNLPLYLALMFAQVKAARAAELWHPLLLPQSRSSLWTAPNKKMGETYSTLK